MPAKLNQAYIQVVLCKYVTLVSFRTVRWVNQQPQQSPTKTKRKEKTVSNWFNRVVSWSVKHNTPRKGELFGKKVPRDESYDLPMVSRFPTIEAWLCSLLAWGMYLPTYTCYSTLPTSSTLPSPPRR